MVVGGLQDGGFLLFGDFQRQVTFNNEAGRDRLLSHDPHLSSHGQVQNCRNFTAQRLPGEPAEQPMTELPTISSLWQRH